MSDQKESNDILGLTAQIVSAHIANNSVPTESLPGLIQEIYKTLVTVGKEAAPAGRRQPAVPVRKSIFPECLVCLEDGKKHKTLKRHLLSAHGMTPEQYRERWGLAADYPMVAPNYARHRSSLAKQTGLGTKRDER